MEIIPKTLISPAGVILIGAIIVALGGFWAEIKNNNIQNELKEKTAKISELNELIVSSITGGDTYPYVRVVFARTNQGKRFPVFQLKSHGENALRNLSVKIIDSDKANEIIKKKEELDERDINTWTTQYNIGDFNPNEIQEIYKFMFPTNKTERTFGLEFFAENGFFKESIKIIKTDDNEYKVESTVTKGEKILDKHLK